MTPSNIKSGCQVTGIYPPNRDVFADFEFRPAEVTDRPLQTNEDPEVLLPQPSSNDGFSEIEVGPKSTPARSTSLPSTSTAAEVTPDMLIPLPKAVPRKDGRARRRSLKSTTLTATSEKDCC